TSFARGDDQTYGGRGGWGSGKKEDVWKAVWGVECGNREGLSGVATRTKRGSEGDGGQGGGGRASWKATHLTIDDLARLDWSCRPAQPSKRKAESSAANAIKKRKQ
ncbi:hypothetical protein ElyMa_001983600, partial [Elysia marginata]